MIVHMSIVIMERYIIVTRSYVDVHEMELAAGLHKTILLRRKRALVVELVMSWWWLCVVFDGSARLLPGSVRKVLFYLALSLRLLPLSSRLDGF